MDIKIIKVGYLETNCYILIKNGKCLVIDPGDDYEKIKKAIGNNSVSAILITHNHYDHIGALKSLINEYNMPVISKNNLEEKEYIIDNFKFDVIYTSGHTDDSLTYYFKNEQIMFTGDFLFKETIGRTDLETGNDHEMFKSLEKIKKYDDNVVIYPGHGDNSTLGFEKKHNPFM